MFPSNRLHIVFYSHYRSQMETQTHAKTTRNEFFLDIISNIWTVWRTAFGQTLLAQERSHTCTSEGLRWCLWDVLHAPCRAASVLFGFLTWCFGTAVLPWKRSRFDVTSMFSSLLSLHLTKPKSLSDYCSRAPFQTLVRLHRQLPTKGDYEHC